MNDTPPAPPTPDAVPLLVKLALDAEVARQGGDLSAYVSALEELHKEAISRKQKLVNAAKLMQGLP